MCQACQNPPGYLEWLKEHEAWIAGTVRRQPRAPQPLPHIKEIRAACRNASRKAEPDYLGPLSLAKVASRLGRHEGLLAEEREEATV
jgi:hypothetical protein